MIEQSKSMDKPSLIEAIGAGVMRYQDATQAFDEMVGQLYGLNPAERHCLSVLWQGPQMASAIAREIKLTPASVTALIDRLEKRGYVRRRADAEDRRRVWVEITEQTQAMTAQTYAPTVTAGAELLARYSVEELAVILRFTTEATELQIALTRQLQERVAEAETTVR